MNPHKNIFVTFVSRHENDEIKLTPLMKTVLKYPNVHFNTLDIIEFSSGTPFEEFVKSDVIKNSKFVVSHTSDVLRLLVLWRYGGTYLDTDMIVRKNLDSAPENFACDDVANGVNGAILNFESSNNGRRLAEKFMNDLIRNFNGSDWGSNGPILITRVLQDLCATNETLKMVEKQNCQGFHVLPRNNCYPITGLSWEKLFNETFAEKAMEVSKDSMVVHFWNNLSKHFELKVNSTAAYVQLAKLHCPKVVASCDEFF